ncbi:MAG: hypothetical protein H6656_11585 [Ardenticatenaceae bacterium]|nr:hypothetical protein [Ardenticatenaceae bacterium]
MGVRAGEQLGVQHPAQINVVHEGGVAFGELDRVHFGFWFADNGRFWHARSGARCRFGVCLGGDWRLEIGATCEFRAVVFGAGDILRRKWRR